MFEILIVHMQGLGQASALNNPLLNITMFAPVNFAFQAPLPAVSLRPSLQGHSLTSFGASHKQAPAITAFIKPSDVG
jgi:hypothetical protein